MGAVRKILLSGGQSNETPFVPLADFFAQHFELNLNFVTNRSLGASANRFVMPGNFPGFAELDLQGVAYRTLRYLTFYNPSSSGYSSYPAVGRLSIAGAHTSSEIFVEQQFTAGAAVPFTIVRQRTGTVHTVTAVSTSGLPIGAASKLTIDAATPWTSVIAGEQFDYSVKVPAGASAGAASFVINLGFGLSLDGTLLGLALTCTSGANVGQFRVIKKWTNSTRTVELVTGFTSPIASTDTFTITPQKGKFEDFGFWLPLCPFEAGDTAGKVNPYPPGFNMPGQWSIPQPYKWDATAGQGIVPKLMAVHTGMASKLQEALGEDIYVITTGVGASSLAHNEFLSAPGNIGWYDPGRERNWAAGEPDNIFRRVIRQVKAGITALEDQGDTGQILLTSFLQGETDAKSVSATAAYLENIRAFKSMLRAELKGLGLWPRSAETIPFFQPKILTPAEGGAWEYAADVNNSIEVAADEDVAAATCEVSDVPQAVAHYTDHTLIERRAVDALLKIQRDTSQRGEVAICNRALKLIRDAGQITSIDPSDGSAQADACADLYPAVRDKLLREHAWGFATTRRKLTAVQSTTTVFEYAYQYPGDVSHVLLVQPEEPVSDNGDIAWNGGGYMQRPVQGYRAKLRHVVERDERSRLVIRTNEPNAELKYVKRVTDTKLFDAMFTDALVYTLASELALALIGGSRGEKLAAGLMQKAMVATGQAETADSDESEDPPDHDASWIEGMH